jgi:hypothetical protein
LHDTLGRTRKNFPPLPKLRSIEHPVATLKYIDGDRHSVCCDLDETYHEEQPKAQPMHLVYRRGFCKFIRRFQTHSSSFNEVATTGGAKRSHSFPSNSLPTGISACASGSYEILEIGSEMKQCPDAKAMHHKKKSAVLRLALEATHYNLRPSHLSTQQPFLLSARRSNHDHKCH